MQPILIFLVLVSLFARGAVAQSLPYDGQEYHLGAIALPTQSTPRDARPEAFAGQTIVVTVPQFNPYNPDGTRRWLTSTWLSLNVVVSQRSTVTNTSPTRWTWGEWSKGVAFFGALGNHALGTDPNHSTTPHFGGGGSILGTCAWDKLDVGETKTFQSDPVLPVLLTDWVGPTERVWQGTGTQTVTLTLADVEQASGFWPGHGSSVVSMDLRLARPGYAWDVSVIYRYTNEPPSVQLGMQPFGIDAPPRFKIVEGPWSDSPTWELGQPGTSPWWLEGRNIDASRILGAFVETYANDSVSFGAEHLGVGLASCAGEARVVSLFEVGGEALPGPMTFTQAVGGGGAPTSLFTYDGQTDWRGVSSLLTLPTTISSAWGMLRPVHDPSIAALPLIPVSTTVDVSTSGLFPVSSFQIAWDGKVDQRTRARSITIER